MREPLNLPPAVAPFPRGGCDRWRVELRESPLTLPSPHGRGELCRAR